MGPFVRSFHWLLNFQRTRKLQTACFLFLLLSATVWNELVLYMLRPKASVKLVTRSHKKFLSLQVLTNQEFRVRSVSAY
jgi:hypothetical protein